MRSFIRKTGEKLFISLNTEYLNIAIQYNECIYILTNYFFSFLITKYSINRILIYEIFYEKQQKTNVY